MAITSLSGYRWKPNTTITITSAATYDIQGVVEGGYIAGIFETTNFELKRAYSYSDFSDEYEFVVALSLGGGYFASPQNTNYWAFESSGSSYPTTLWIYTEDRNATITFKSGADLTNATLIAWLEANGTLEKELVLQLAPFLKDIANAIRTKKGTTDTINAQNFASEIESIETGGGSGATGGLTGYTIKDGYITSSVVTAFAGLLEDGSVVEEHTAGNKYLFIILLVSKHVMRVTNGEFGELGAINVTTSSPTYIVWIKPTADDCYYTIYGGGGSA